VSATQKGMPGPGIKPVFPMCFCTF